MGNTYSFFQTNAINADKLDKFKIQKIPTFEEISEELSNGITEELIDDVFERCCFMSIETFFDKYPSDDTLKCQYSPKHTDWFFTCKQCCLADNSCICAQCFLSGNHIENGHQFTIFESSSSAVCDCGNPEAIKGDGFCHEHHSVDEDSQKKRLDGTPFFVRKDIHIFFRYLFRYLQKITTSTTELSKTREEEINVITGWLSGLCSYSSTLIHIMAEELTSRCLDSKDFKIYDLKRLPYENPSDNTQQQWESHHFLGFIFSRINILELFVPLLTLLLDNHNTFKLALFEEYLKNYILIFSPRDSRSSRLMQNLGSYYMDNMKLLVPFSTGYSRYNFIELVLRSHKNIYMPLLLPFYQTDKKIEKEVMLQSDLSSFSRLMKDINVVKFLINDEEKYRLYFELSETLHAFTSPQFVDPSITTTKFLVLLEHKLMYATRHLHSAIDAQNDPALSDFARDTTLKRIAESISHIKKRPLFERCGFKLPHADFFQKFTYNEIPIHFALYRVISFFFLHTKMDPSILMTKYGVTEDDIVDMLTTLLLFRVCYVSYDPTDSLENCTDFTIITDLHLMQVALCLLGPKKFLYAFFNVMSSVDTNASASAFTDTFALLISVIQLRGTLEPTKDYIQYNLYQALFSGIFFKLHFRSFDTVLFGVTETDICELYLPEISLPGNHAKELKDKESWKYYDPYYPCFSIVYKNVIKNNTKERFKKYQASLNIPESNPLPPQIPAISKELLGVNNIFEDPTLFEMIFCVLLDLIYPEFVGYDDSFEMQPILKILIRKPDIIANEFFYLLVLGIKTFKEHTYPNFDQLTKDQINQSIKEYFEAEDKSTVKFQQNFAILNLLRVHNVEVSIGQKEKLSFLQVLFEFWVSMTKDSKFLELRSSLLYIFTFVKDFHPDISEYFIENKIDLVQDLETSSQDEIIRKKLMAEKREKILEQMRVQQKSFLSNYNYDDEDGEEEEDEEEEYEENEEDTEDEEEKLTLRNNETVEEEKPNQEVKSFEYESNQIYEDYISDDENLSDEANQNLNADDNESKVKKTLKPKRKIEFSAEEIGEFEPCVICKTGERGGRLFSMAYVDVSSPNMQNKLQTNFEMECKEGVDQTYKDFLHIFVTENVKIGISQYVPYDEDPATLLACYIFNRSPSTYVSSCHHTVHKKCIDDYIRDQKIDDIVTSFKCPLCSRACDIIVPLGKPESSQEYKEGANNLYSELCHYDYATLMDSQNKYSINKYLWKFVLQNIETLELKSRKTTLYSEDGEPYFIMSETDFQKELLTTSNLYRVIDNAPLAPEPNAPMFDKAVFFIDPFVSSSYTAFLTKKNHDEIIYTGVFFYLFSVLIHHVIETNKIPKEHLNNKSQLFSIIESEYKNIFSGKELEENLKKKLQNQIHPYLRKVIIYFYIFNYYNDQSKFPFKQITISNLDSFDFCTKFFLFGSFEELLRKGFEPRVFEDLLKNYLNTPKISNEISNIPQVYCIYPPPCNYEVLPSFTPVPDKYIDFMKENIHSGNCTKCKSLLKLVCLFCGVAVCSATQCTNGVLRHVIACPCYPLGLFQHIENPLLQVNIMEYGAFKKTNLVSHIYLDNNGSKPNAPGTNIFLSKKKLRKLYKNWIDYNNSRKFLK
ncbi:hypothetical protein DICPUDRAFT_86584 [Dictyostelium purpureum]|uniref:E3 ubiquitin-protein ligase n=1 Tax=Dictyostelium purpureum TaxID=5786 RepID=F0ZCM2_DICPU|nr:uncharacterized protein DICPUDRAFT_86584 [Dictyostelium purpureum]EGC38295.1 hypothetical protein DICPUDRAFT_86584 [Dictyostelium purpureum]|eukprot:XP_003285156.1 hypothetical protein DICPUDRAFT_86584 [Dictyostelium purpureum]